MVEIRVPTLGESVSEATVATWFKKVGDMVKVDEMLCELETDKVTVEVPSKASGVLAEIVAKEGETVGVDVCVPLERRLSRVPGCAGAARRWHAWLARRHPNLCTEIALFTATSRREA